MILVGFTGPAGCGKSTAAKFLLDYFRNHHSAAAIFPFAEPVKNVAREMGWNGEKDAKGRRLLQLIGTECGRQCIDQNIWVKHWRRGIESWRAGLPFTTEEPVLAIADDVRFDNEASVIVRMGGNVVEIQGRGYDLGANSGHASEAAIDPKGIAATIVNNGTMDEFKEQIVEFARQLER